MMVTAKNGVILTYDGNKFFWRTRNTVDVVIAQHIKANLFEIIVYDPALDKEAPRMYLKSDELIAIIGQVDIDAKLSFAVRNSVPLTEKFVQGVKNTVISEYLLARLVIKEVNRVLGSITAGLQINDIGSLACTPPQDLEPYRTRHYKQLTKDEVLQAMQELEQEKKELQDTTESASQLATQTLVSLTVRERWRIPLVMGRMLKGKPLRATDKKVFRHVQMNMKSDEDVARMRNVLNAAPSSMPTPRSSRPHRSPSRTPPRTPPRTPRSSLFAPTESSMGKSLSPKSSFRNPKGNNGAASPNRAKSSKKVKSPKRKRSSKPGAGTAGEQQDADGNGEDDGELGDDKDSTLDRFISNLAALGTSIKASFGLSGSASTKGADAALASASTVDGGDVAGMMGTHLDTRTRDGSVELYSASQERSTSVDASQPPMAHGTVSGSQPVGAAAHMPATTAQEGSVAEIKVKSKPAKRGSMLASFLLAFTGDSSAPGSDGANRSSMFFPNITSLVRWGMIDPRQVAPDN